MKTAQQYRDHAEELRASSGNWHSVSCRRMVLEMARDWDYMAELRERINDTQAQLLRDPTLSKSGS